MTQTQQMLAHVTDEGSWHPGPEPGCPLCPVFLSPRRCQAIVPNGSRCKVIAKAGEHFCRVHRGIE